jgi:Fe-S-cluster containining protein
MISPPAIFLKSEYSGYQNQCICAVFAGIYFPPIPYNCATEEDIDLWEIEGRDDILEWVGFIPLGDEYIYDLWIDPQTDDDVTRCPWLKKLSKQNKYICCIHDVKPHHCRVYPKSKQHAEETGCPGFNVE